MKNAEDGYISVEKERVLPLAICSDDNYAAYTEVLFYTVMKHLHRDWRCEAYLLTRGISPEKAERLKSFCATLPRFQLTVVDIPDSSLEGRHLSNSGTWTEAVYYRFLIPELVGRYTRVLYMDIDMVVEGDLSPLMQVDMGDNYLAAVPDEYLQTHEYFKKVYAVEKLGIPVEAPYRNSGLLVMNIPGIIRDKVMDSAFETLAKLGTPTFVDQDVINACCHARMASLDAKWNVFHYDMGLAVSKYSFQDAPIVTHFTSPKPWRFPLHPLVAKWWKYRDEATRHYESSLAGKTERVDAVSSVRFSIIMILHNAASKVQSCISSILRQTYVNFELLVCDDKSDDNTLELLGQLAQQDSRIHFYHQHLYLGNAVTRSLLARLISGTYVILMDANDILAPDFLERASAALDETDCDILGMPYEVIAPEGCSTIMQQPGMMLTGGAMLPFYLNIENPVGDALVRNDNQHPWTLCAKVIKADVLKQSLPPMVDTLRDMPYLMFSLFHHCRSYRWAALERTVWRRDVPNDVLHQLGKQMSLDTFRMFCEALLDELRYKLDGIYNARLDANYVLAAINSGDLGLLLQSLAAFAPAQQPSALKVFFEYFCRDGRTLSIGPYVVDAEPVLKTISQMLPYISPALVEKCRQLAQTGGNVNIAIPEEYLQAYAMVQNMKNRRM